ncbi:C4-dicarboxylate TRAP transporter substrate-binding protein [Sulfitobacter dubius]|uniref:C4-dicarboxylate TRAP transporter substrate-binding protein n=1 Tax=Sulfitobacter dubius TaxID=218673 RepID=UPI0022B02B14|nr:C4-dicarboxylate TRAP transporter substrate-binding protein [Sulfitobacter dubius]MCZ4366303.1 C4-dicarboxylate TRAP transporter substrate-binding protein [Sulfitobacter dubius]
MYLKKTIAITVASFALSATSVTARDITYAHFLPAAGSIRDATVAYFDRVSKATDGELTFETFWAGAMGGPVEMLDTIGSQTVDAGGIVDAYLRSSIPTASMFSDFGRLVSSNEDMLAYSAAVTEQQLLSCQECTADYENNNVKLLATTAVAPYYIMCKPEVTSTADMVGKKVRAVGNPANLMQQMGAVPVSVTTAEMYEAMQRGQADCSTGSAAWLDEYKLGEFVKSMINEPINDYISSGNILFNLDVWNDFSDAQRAAFVEELPAFVAQINFEALSDADKAIEAAKANGLKIYEPDDEFKTLIAEFRGGTFADAITTAEGTGVKVADRVVSDFEALVEKWSAIVTDIGMDQDAYEEALRTEIYSKLPN